MVAWLAVVVMTEGGVYCVMFHTGGGDVGIYVKGWVVGRVELAATARLVVMGGLAAAGVATVVVWMGVLALVAVACVSGFLTV